MLVTRKGNALRFNEEAVRAMGSASHGVQGIRLSDKDELAGVAMVREGEQMLLVSEFGYGKRTEYDNFSPHGRGTRGQICYKTTEKTGEVIGVLSVSDKDDLVCITSQGNALKLRLSEGGDPGKDRHGGEDRQYHQARRRGGCRARGRRKSSPRKDAVKEEPSRTGCRSRSRRRMHRKTRSNGEDSSEE